MALEDTGVNGITRYFSLMCAKKSKEEDGGVREEGSGERDRAAGKREEYVLGSTVRRATVAYPI